MAILISTHAITNFFSTIDYLVFAPQTIGTFLFNIREHFPIFYSNQYIRISVKQHPFHDTVFTEGHIYLPHEDILPNHTTYIPLEELS